MHGLFGDFATMPLKDLIVYLGNKRATGVLGLENEGVRKQAVLRDGKVLNASSNEPREYLGQFLINLGHITEEQFNSAYETQKETKIFLGKILVMIGAVREDQLSNALNLKFRETLLQAFNWTDGTFQFQADTVPELPDGLDLEIDLLDVHREGEFRETAWQAIRAAFPSGSVRLTLSEHNLPEPPKPGSLDARLFQLIREGHTVDEIILALHATDFFLYQRLYALYRLEAVRVQDVASAAVPSSVTASRPQTGPADAAQIETLRRALIEGRPIATLLVPPSKLRALQLSAPERYLLSRVDGMRDIASIVQVSPLHELEALKLFQRLVDAGLVKVQRVG